MAQDFYSTLGVSKSASQDEIKKAYRKLAHQHHPDKSGGDEKKFKEINEAYQVLSNPEKRSQYDRFGQTHEQASRNGGGFSGGGQGSPFEGFDFSGFTSGGNGFGFGGGVEDMFSDFFGGGGGRRGASARGRDIQVDVEIDFLDMASEVTREVRLRKRMVCSECHGGGGAPGASVDTCKECHGSGQVRKTIRTILGSIAQAVVCPKCRGKGKTFEKACHKCRGEGVSEGEETIQITIPAGIDDGQTLSMEGKGEAGEYGAPAGSLYVVVHVRPHKEFIRKGQDLHSSVHIALSQAILGDQVAVKTLEGETKMKIPAGTQSGELFRIRSEGFPVVQGRGRGDHIVKVVIDIPKKLSRDQRKLVETLQKEGL